MTAQADIWLGDDISISDVEDYSLQSGDVTIHMTGDGWWRMIQALQDWLGSEGEPPLIGVEQRPDHAS